MSLSLLLEAIKAGAIQVQEGRIQDHAGCLYPDARTLVVNPDATPEDQLAALHDQLLALLDHDGVHLDLPAPRTPTEHPVLRLVEPG